MPTYREIGEYFGFKSPKAATDHVAALEKKGYVRCRVKRSRGIELVHSEAAPDKNMVIAPVIGQIVAGHPQAETEFQRNSLTVDKTILGRSAGHRLFSLLVDGDSMRDCGIYHGDWVVADADTPAREGDVVVALIDGENTLKILAMEQGSYYLKAGNPAYSDLIPFEEMIVQGVVKVVLRRMGRH